MSLFNKKDQSNFEIMKFYFREDDDERCYREKDILEDMRENGLTELKVFEAKRELANDYFWCSASQEAGIIGDGCGRFCLEYKPRNRKNGRCCFSGHCYEPTEKSIILKT